MSPVPSCHFHPESRMDFHAVRQSALGLKSGGTGGTG
eukprot:CAMPEP_0113587684 /NCGR_PEP_ID=MMETSP0015_2-20120614/35052_1 /TAXON_ID=2838 /ORGANISM="Odontella" /LENGTH=36 /DNA_ID=CAMNT_0000493385 /DNA_START=61 /DNA_END=168 /DNA_ORIENTATION=- /assembly_acc=CAM_ASM_000160